MSNQKLDLKTFDNTSLENYKLAALNFSGTGLKHFPFKVLPETIQILDLSNNEIDTLPNKDIKKAFPNIKRLILSDNEIE